MVNAAATGATGMGTAAASGSHQHGMSINTNTYALSAQQRLAMAYQQNLAPSTLASSSAAAARAAEAAGRIPGSCAETVLSWRRWPSQPDEKQRIVWADESEE